MSYIKELKDSLVDCIVFTSSLPETKIYYLNENGPEPSGNSIGVNLAPLKPTNQPYQSTLTDNDYTLQVISTFSSKVTLIFKGVDAEEISTDFYHNLSHVKYWQEFTAKNISILTARSLGYQPEKRDTKWITRYAIEIDIAFSAVSREEVDVIERVEYEDLLGNSITIP